jgi:hypothetical protein
MNVAERVLFTKTAASLFFFSLSCVRNSSYDQGKRVEAENFSYSLT